jgi:hypothetical protein
MTAFSLQLATRTAEGAAAESDLRRIRARDLEESLAEVKGISLIRTGEGCEPGYLRFPVLLEGGVASLPNPRKARALGIMPGYPLALPDLPELRNHLVDSGPAVPGARRLARDLLTLPTHRFVTPKVVGRITRTLLGSSRVSAPPPFEPDH